MTFSERIKIGFDFMDYTTTNRIRLPRKLKARKLIFIKWYVERNRNKPYAVIIKELANEIFFVKEVTLETLLFNER